MSNISISGMGADSTFGAFNVEYYRLANEYLEQDEFEKAFDTFAAAKVSFENTSENLPDMFVKYSVNTVAHRMLEKLQNFFRPELSAASTQFTAGGVLKVPLPSPSSAKVKSYAEAMRYASYDGASRAVYLLNQDHGITLLFPYEGYRFYELSQMCDPHIFCNKVNKFCLRYAAAGILPHDIVNDKTKRGNPGIRLSSVLANTDNATKLQEYLRSNISNIVDSTTLLRRLESSMFDKSDFLALSLLVFENLLRENYGLHIKLG